jgi:hypothetical protein
MVSTDLNIPKELEEKPIAFQNFCRNMIVINGRTSLHLSDQIKCG